MLLKTIWMSSSTLGFSMAFAILTFCVSCNETEEYRIYGDFKYVNETNHEISLNYLAYDSSDVFEITTIPSGESMVIEAIAPSEKNEKNLDNCDCQKLLMDLIGYDYPNLIIFDNELCNYFEINKSYLYNLDSYEQTQISQRNFQFTYRFTEKDYDKAVECN